MRFSLFSRVLIPFLVLLLACLAVVAWEASRFLHQFYLEHITAELASDVQLASHQFDSLIPASSTAEIQSLCRELGAVSGKRITVILPSGQVLGDSNEDPAKMDNHADRPEIRDAVAGGLGRSIRYSHTLHSNWIYVASPLMDGQKTAAIVRISMSLDSVDGALTQVYLRTAAAAAAVALFAVLTSLLITRRIARPLSRMKTGVERFAQGDFSQRLRIPSAAELSELAEAMNRMATELNERIQTIHRQRDELDAVLASMKEGVLALDQEERILRMNPAAARLFGIPAYTAEGRRIQEVIRYPRLQRCAAQTFSSGETLEEEIVVAKEDELYLHVTSTILRDGQNQRVGVLLVFNDITRLRRLERARSDFVANVSHEIRTPVTAIKGYAETLLGQEVADAETAEKFLETIVRQAARLSALVDDILSLAGLEQAERAGGTPFEQIGLRGVIDAAIQGCLPKAMEKSIRFTVSGDDLAEAMGHAALLEQAFVNLLDNAVKYSAENAQISIGLESGLQQTVIHVRDTGCGIAAEHLPRIFERFYRVDQARSRKLGGTGLGLAIVKHIVLLHGGQVAVESKPGKGSCFSVYLPRSGSGRAS